MSPKFQTIRTADVPDPTPIRVFIDANGTACTVRVTDAWQEGEDLVMRWADPGAPVPPFCNSNSGLVVVGLKNEAAAAAAVGDIFKSATYDNKYCDLSVFTDGTFEGSQ